MGRVAREAEELPLGARLWWSERLKGLCGLSQQASPSPNLILTLLA